MVTFDVNCPLQWETKNSMSLGCQSDGRGTGGGVFAVLKIGSFTPKYVIFEVKEVLISY